MLPYASTTITIRRVPASSIQDPYDAPPAPSVVAAGVRATFGGQRGTTVLEGTGQAVVQWRLDTDPCDLRDGDLVTDEATGAEYTVDWSRARPGLGLDHTEAAVRQVPSRNPALA